MLNFLGHLQLCFLPCLCTRVAAQQTVQTTLYSPSLLSIFPVVVVVLGLELHMHLVISLRKFELLLSFASSGAGHLGSLALHLLSE